MLLITIPTQRQKYLGRLLHNLKVELDCENKGINNFDLKSKTVSFEEF
jgi:hypothetical protein